MAKENPYQEKNFKSNVVNPKGKARDNKMIYAVQGDYGSGFEDVTYEEFYGDAKSTLRDYEENEPQYAHRIIQKREDAD